MMPPLCLREKSNSVEAGPQNYRGLKTHLAQEICVDAIRQEVQVNKLEVQIFLGPNTNHSATVKTWSKCRWSRMPLILTCDKVFCGFSIQLQAVVQFEKSVFWNCIFVLLCL